MRPLFFVREDKKLVARVLAEKRRRFSTTPVPFTYENRNAQSN